LPAKELAYRYVRSEVLAKAPSQPEFLAEETVATALGVSRTPVREAFLRLEAEGFLSLVPRKGALLRPITEREISEVMEVRLLIECSAAEKAVVDGSRRARLVERLSELGDELVALAKESDVSLFIDCDRRFHEEIVAAANNATLLDLYHRLRDRQLGMGLRAVLDNADRLDAVCEEHASIISAFDKGDLPAVRAAITAHLDTTAGVLRSRLSIR
jgi:DNA-binding GntR family transcriptional regulator